MFQSFFNSLSGLFSFSRSLDTISNNISNMNTPGFRGSDSYFRNIVGGNGSGYGTQIEGQAIRLGGGEVRQTGNESDLALNGSGFFLLRNDAGESFYSRAGQFQFNEDGLLVDASTGFRVAGIDDAGNLIDISIEEMRTLPPVASTSVDLAGNLSTTAGAHNIDDISLFDAEGESFDLNIVLTDNSATTPNSWTIDVTDESGAVVGSGELRFGADGSPLTGFNSLDVTVTRNGVDQTISLNFGEPGSFSGATQFSGSASNLGVRDVDGSALAGLTSFSFDEDGILQLNYSNGEEQEGQQLALAHFDDETKLEQVSGGLFSANATTERTIGRANENVFGSIEGGALEMANVDLTREFADMMIVQRGYQASSRVMNVANELVEQLYNSTRGR